jgi:hypothetical protein
MRSCTVKRQIPSVKKEIEPLGIGQATHNKLNRVENIINHSYLSSKTFHIEYSNLTLKIEMKMCYRRIKLFLGAFHGTLRQQKFIKSILNVRTFLTKPF